MIKKTRSSEQTRIFYNEGGWRLDEGTIIDKRLFGVREDGPIRIELHRLHFDRIRSALSQAGIGLNLLECGCGGNPERQFLDLCVHYTGIDFSETGLQLARSSFSDVQIPHEFQNADACALPFADGTFDAVYCAHMIYHLDEEVQEEALAEMMRVVRPGGIVIIVAANPYPLAFPVRLARRLLAAIPGVQLAIDFLRSSPPLPYKPMPINWMRRRLARAGTVGVITYSLPSTYVNQNISEFWGVGRLLWKTIRWLDLGYPRLSAYLGNYVTIMCWKRIRS